MTYNTYFGTFYIILIFLYKETSIQQTELAWPLLYHGDANGSSFNEADGFVFYFADRLSLMRNPEKFVWSCPSTFLALKVQLVVLVSALIRDGQYSLVSFLLAVLLLNGAPRAQPFVKVARGGTCPMESALLQIITNSEKNTKTWDNLIRKNGVIRQLYQHNIQIKLSKAKCRTIRHQSSNTENVNCHCMFTSVKSTM